MLAALVPWEDIRTIWISVLNIMGAVVNIAAHLKFVFIVSLLLWSGALALFGTRNVVKWPVVFVLGVIILMELSMYIMIRLLVHGFERCCYTSKARGLRDQMSTEPTTYEHWLKLGEELDSVKKLDSWRKDSKSDSRYNWSLIERLASQLREHRNSEEARKLLQVFAQCTRKNLGGIWKEKLYSVSYTGKTKDAVHGFADELEQSLDWLAKAASTMSDNSLMHTIRFMTRVKKAYGEVGLFLSGGASNGNYHWGVIRALLDQGHLPRYLSGTSAGAVVASLIGTRTDEELRSLLVPEVLSQKLTCFDETWVKCLSRYAQFGCLFSKYKWINKIKWFTKGDTTFQEAYERTGRVININVSEPGEHGQPVMLNHDTCPDVVIYSAVIASAAMKNFVKPQALLVKRPDGSLAPRQYRTIEKFVDGCFQRDLPVRELSEMYNIRFSVVSQVGPHAVPFHFRNQGEAGMPSRWRRSTGGWRGGFLLSACEMILKTEMRKNLIILNRLGLVNQDNIGATSLFLQTFEGDITIVPPVYLWDYYKLISDPGKDLERYFNIGQRLTWKKLPMLSLRMQIGAAVTRCLDALLAKGRERKVSDEVDLPSPGGTMEKKRR